MKYIVRSGGGVQTRRVPLKNHVQEKRTINSFPTQYAASIFLFCTLLVSLKMHFLSFVFLFVFLHIESYQSSRFLSVLHIFLVLQAYLIALTFFHFFIFVHDPHFSCTDLFVLLFGLVMWPSPQMSLIYYPGNSLQLSLRLDSLFSVLWVPLSVFLPSLGGHASQ